ncbi:hypothetical protein A2U01_0074677 [Trifolium medium]|uniref:Uncharacterized protein n=1 Tax=Trifolium medium TaxID=97028 RepID=A0A392SZX2_9FABA|nr:hypothetical protein [Trifolium medium]
MATEWQKVWPPPVTTGDNLASTSPDDLKNGAWRQGTSPGESTQNHTKTHLEML